MSRQAYNYLMNIPLHYWTVHAFDTKCNHITNNVVETTNEWVKAARKLPILQVVETIWKQITKHLVDRFEQCKRCSEDELPPNIQKVLSMTMRNGRGLLPMQYGEFSYEVSDGNMRYVVDLESKYCDCGIWTVSGLPCSYGLHFIMKKKNE